MTTAQPQQRQNGKYMTKNELNDILQEMIREASAGEGHISRSKVEERFRDEHFSPEQIDMVCEFLLSRKVIVDGYIRKEEEKPEESGDTSAETAWSEDEQKWLDIYEADLAGIRPEKAGEWEKLLAELRSGASADAKRRISEIFLPEVLKIAREMYRPGMILQDIIQEGSLQLVLFADQIDASVDTDETAVRKALDTELREGIQAYIASQDEVHARDSKLVKKAEDFHDGVETLKNEYGRKVYLDEAADFMNISEDEAEAILRLTGDQVPDDTGNGHASPAEDSTKS